jgi:hypothetical protein
MALNVVLDMSCNVSFTFDFDFGVDHLLTGGYISRDLALQVWGVTDETVIHGYGSCATLTSE